VIGEIHAYTPSIHAFRHLLTDLSIVVVPNWQGKEVGEQFFQAFLTKVEEEFQHILRVELFVRSANTRAI